MASPQQGQQSSKSRLNKEYVKVENHNYCDVTELASNINTSRDSGERSA